jgi:hypothetical protein
VSKSDSLFRDDGPAGGHEALGFYGLDKSVQAISAESIRSLASGIRRDEQRIPLTVNSIGGKKLGGLAHAVDDLAKRFLKRLELAIVDGAQGLKR